MKPGTAILTIGVDNLERSFRFYHEGLGLASEGIVGKEFEHGAVAFFDLQNGLRLALYERVNLAWDCGLPPHAASPTEFAIGHFVNSREDVDATMQLAKVAGATIVKPAQETFWGGYAGYFQDPDGHLWEVGYNPASVLFSGEPK